MIKIIKHYFILGLTICALYYLIFKYKGDQEWKLMAGVGAFGGMIASIASLLEGYFPSSKTLIKNIFAFPVFITLFIFFYLLIPMIWRMRKDPTKKTMIYVSFGFLILGAVLIIAIFILNLFGFFG